MKAKLAHLFQSAQSKEAFFAGFSEAQLELYIRGKTIGIKDLLNDRKHRLKTLGLLAEFETCSKRIELDEMKKTSSAKPKRERQTKQAKIESNASKKETVQSETGQTKSAQSKTKDSMAGKTEATQAGKQTGNEKNTENILN